MNFIKNYRHLILMYIIYIAAIGFIWLNNGCVGQTKIMRKGGTIVIKKKVVKMWTGMDCLYCDKAREFFKENNIEYTEKDFHCKIDNKELMDLANKLNFNTYWLDGVPVIVIDNKKIIPGFSKDELTCLILNKECGYKVYNRFIEVKKHKGK